MHANYFPFKLRSCLLSVATSIFLCFPAVAADLNAVTESLPPLNYEAGGQISGYSTDLLRAMLQQANLTADINLMPWARAYQTALVQPNTLIFTMTRTPEREHLFAWIGPISPRQIYVYKLRDRKDIHIKTLQDIGAYRIGAVRDMASTLGLLSKLNIAQDKLDLAPTAESNLKKLFMDRVDVIIALDWGIYQNAKLLGHRSDELEQGVLVDNSHAYYFAMNKQSDPEMVTRLRQALDKVHASGLMDNLKDKYMHY